MNFKFDDYHYKFKEKGPFHLELFVISKSNGVIFGFIIQARGNPSPEQIFNLFIQTYNRWFIDVESEIITEKKKRGRPKKVKLLEAAK